MLRYFTPKRRDPCVASCDLLRVCRATLNFCKFLILKYFKIYLICSGSFETPKAPFLSSYFYDTLTRLNRW